MNELTAEINHNLIIPTLSPVNLHGDNIEHLLLGTIAKESAFRELRQHGYRLESDSGAFGLFQIERHSHYLAYKHALDYHPKIHSYLLELGGGNSVKYNLMYNFPYQVLIARILYLSIKVPLPHYTDIEGMAHYWNDYYNRKYKKGTPEYNDYTQKFIDAYNDYIA